MRVFTWLNDKNNEIIIAYAVAIFLINDELMHNNENLNN